MPNKKKPRPACAYCGKEVPKPQYKYCNNTCQHDKEWELRKKRIEETGNADLGSQQNRPAKKYLLEVRGHQCEICGLKEWMNKPIPLVLDHIDGNSDNWLLVNIRLICCNCDAQTPTYKAKNKGNGRAWRRQRYAEGKSY